MTAPDPLTRVALRLLEAERLSLGRAAELAGRSVPELVRLLGYGDVPFVDTTADEPEPVAA